MNELKSIKPLCPRTLIYVFLSMTIIFPTDVVAADVYLEIIRDLPTPREFPLYLNALEMIVHFCTIHKVYLDMNLEFGLFLVNVNLKKYVQDTQNDLPKETRFHLTRLLLKIDVLANYFRSMIYKNKHVKEYKQGIKITNLFHNATTWPRSPDQFNTDLLDNTTIYTLEELKNIYGEWTKYFNDVNDFNKYKPSPKESDKCIGSLNRTPPSRFPTACTTPLHCKNKVQTGSQFGYGLAHRILFLAVARFARKCILISEKEDKDMTDKYCSISYNEAQYLAFNNFKLPDLIFEQMAICGLFGHGQFLRNTWIESLLQFQTSAGCFSETIGTRAFNENLLRESENDKWKIANADYIMNGQCNGHFTAVAAATLSQGLRYIIEKYYVSDEPY